MADNIQLQNGQNLQVDENLVADPGLPTVEVTGDNVQVNVDSDGAVLANDAGNTAILSSGNNVEVSNSGEISGAFNGVSSSDNFRLRNSS